MDEDQDASDFEGSNGLEGNDEGITRVDNS